MKELLQAAVYLLSLNLCWPDFSNTLTTDLRCLGEGFGVNMCDSVTGTVDSPRTLNNMCWTPTAKDLSSMATVLQTNITFRRKMLMVNAYFLRLCVLAVSVLLKKKKERKTTHSLSQSNLNMQT